RALAAAARFANACQGDGATPAAVLLLERLGDIVAASAVVASLRADDPALRFCWFGRARYRDVALRVPGVEEFVAVDCYGELAAVVRGLDGFRQIDLNLNGKSCACCGGAWRNLGGGALDGAAPDTENYYEFGPLAQAFAIAGGIEWQEGAPALAPPAAAEIPRALPSGPYVVLHSESEESARNWRDDGWRALVDLLLAETALTVVHVGMTPARWLPADPRVVDFAGRTDVSGLLAVVRDCALFVGIDSSVAHIANAYRRPGLVLLGRYRRFATYWPYSGYYGSGGSDGGALVVRFVSECPFLPVEIGVRALRVALRRLPAAGADAAVRGIGVGGPWDVQAQEIANGSFVQDAVCDVAALIRVDGEPEAAAAVAAWPGELDALVLVLAVAPEPAMLERLERLGCRFVVAADNVDPAITASFRYLRDRGRPAELAHALQLDVTAPPLAGPLPAGGCRWFRCDDLAVIPTVHARVAAERRLATGLPGPGVELAAASSELRAGIDSVARTPAGAVQRLSGWLVLPSTQSPPAVVCIAERLAEGRFRARAALPFSRLERPDVARALGADSALFSGLALEVPPELQQLGSAFAVLVLDRQRAAWQRLELPG
ncbi:MAG: hypothetical protein KDE27_07330, partial [Planctomycetes bacterium]|nr:hypothetical protein [Planctomycetota bacterium]